LQQPSGAIEVVDLTAMHEYGENLTPNGK